LYGKVQFSSPRAYVAFEYDDETRRFTREGAAVDEFPEYVIVQRSPLVLYSRVPESLRPLLEAQYDLVRSFKTGSEAVPASRYDAGDAFFIPMSGLEGLSRPGPDFYVYRRSRRGS
jgi:hypothetical protein